MSIKYTGTRYLREYALHLKGLPQHDRYTRFGASVSETTIDTLILSMLYNPEMHHLFTSMENGKIIGFAHLAIDHGATWELAVSVDSDYQGQGIGDRLMSAAINWAKLHGIESMFMHCISNNKKIQHLATKHGLKVIERSGSEITSEMKLPEPTSLDHIKEYTGNQMHTLSKIARLNMKLFGVQ